MNSLKTLLVGINAKYIHSNLAIRYLRQYARAFGHEFSIIEFTINQHYEQLIADIFKQSPDVLGFSCYIWNIGIVARLVSDIKKILPETRIVLGGPEVADRDTHGADYVITGEGEKSFLELVCALEQGKTPEIKEGSDFTKTVFPYCDEDFAGLDGRIIYYEAQRGCPYKCAYCLSADGGVAFLPIERIFGELSVFIEKKVKQVKFVDRTFNCDKSFSRSIWKYLIENDNGITNFHFEIVAELLDDEDFALLAGARKALFQFEIGVQSTNAVTLKEIGRNSEFRRLAKNVRKLSETGNIHLHLDLIAGLPFESLVSFKESFNDVFSLRPDMLQLGFLKVLKGGRIRKNAETYGIQYSEYAPYEVLRTNDISASELFELKSTEHIVESYYNSGIAVNSIQYILRAFESAFDFFFRFGRYWDTNAYGGVQHSKAEMYEILYEFAESCHCGEAVKDIVIYDMLLSGNIKTLPERFNKPLTDNQRAFVAELYGSAERLAEIEPSLALFEKKQLWKMCNVFFFDYAVNGEFEKAETVILFHYPIRNGAGTAYPLEMEAYDDKA